MDEIIVLSGKGGTGKTSVAASLAMIAGKEVIVADCDVDAANMHLLLEPDFRYSEEFFSGILPEINQLRCDQCGKCHEVCRFDAIPYNGGMYNIDSLYCEGCGYCEKVCPVDAVSLHERKAGYVYHSEIRSGTQMIHARLDPGAENSGKLVAKVKNDARTTASQLNKHIILVDGSPGIGCPVVSSLSGASLALIITEPSLSALHDMKRLFAMLVHFRIPALGIINKSDINTEIVSEIHKWLNENQIQCISEIPFDESFVLAMIEKKSLVEYHDKYYKLFSSVWNTLKEFLKTNKKEKLL
jgi:MinD superfamily P-loop ATPase